jgi:hypothetical protein
MRRHGVAFDGVRSWVLLLSSYWGERATKDQSGWTAFQRYSVRIKQDAKQSRILCVAARIQSLSRTWMDPSEPTHLFKRLSGMRLSFMMKRRSKQEVLGYLQCVSIDSKTWMCIKQVAARRATTSNHAYLSWGGWTILDPWYVPKEYSHKYYGHQKNVLHRRFCWPKMVDYRKISFRQQDIFIRREIVRAVTLRIEESFDEVDRL